LAFGAYLAIWLARERVKLDGLSLDTLAHVAAIAVAAVTGTFTYLMASEQSNRTLKQQMYQSLELQSISLFRFEADKEKLVFKLWNADSPPNKPIERYELKQYVCQMLNLFEMAYRFRLEGILPPAAFGSWVIWMWELCNAPVFRALWADEEDGLPLNYVREFRDAIDCAIKIAEQQDTDASTRRKAFFNWVGEHVGCKMVRGWLDHKGPTAAVLPAH
jgi:hypothetical protein